MPKKLIEVALPLEEINVASAREKSIRHGHPSTLHLWWARRPLAAARAVIFSSLITDPSDSDFPWKHGEAHDVERERARLHDLIVRMVQWENSTNESVLAEVHAEIHRHTNGNPPPLIDPFAGGGAIPLEAQRLGLEAHASDLNPVAVLINKAMIEIPPKFGGQAPVNPERQRTTTTTALWKGATGLADDVRYYGKWMRDEAERRIGHVYPKVQLPADQGGGEATVIAWLWARTVTCPNPACGAEMPLVSSFWLSKKKGRESWLAPSVEGKLITFEIRSGSGEPANPPKQGRGAKFACIVCGEIAPEKHIKSEGSAKRMHQRLLAVVAEGRGGRSYVAASTEQEQVAHNAKSNWKPTQQLPNDPRNFWTPAYGLTHFGDLFTERQLVALTTFSDLIGEARERVLTDAISAERSTDPTRLTDGGTGAAAYADAVSTYLAFAVDKGANLWSSLVSWMSDRGALRETFARQALPMVWDFAEVNPFSNSGGNLDMFLARIVDVIDSLPTAIFGDASQADASRIKGAYLNRQNIVSTDPPYYDNIGYADLSDFFYVWLTRSMKTTWPNLFGTLLAPKSEELVATPYRFEGGKAEAEEFFETGLQQTFSGLASIQHRDFPLTVYYAYKQSETESGENSQVKIASTGWEKMLEGLIVSGFQITATWPMRTEGSGRILAKGTNALDSSVIHACRVRHEHAPEITRQQFVRELKSKMSSDLRPLQQANIAPVDLAQAAIGPGMAIYSRYSRVREASGDTLRVRGALALINQALDEVLAEQDEEYDNATRWAINFYELHGMNEGPYRDAEGFARARNVAVHDLAHDGVVKSGHGKVQFVLRTELPPLEANWKPKPTDVSDWTIMQRLAHAVLSGQESAAAIKAMIDQTMPGRSDTARDLAYRIFNIAERKGWNREALVYNTLVQNWSEVQRASHTLAPSDIEQQLHLVD